MSLGNDRSELTLAIRRAAAVAATYGRTRATKFHMPFAGRTMAEVIADQERGAPKPVDPCDYCWTRGRCTKAVCPMRGTA